jgi:hypothetical protein
MDFTPKTQGKQHVFTQAEGSINRAHRHMMTNGRRKACVTEGMDVYELKAKLPGRLQA